MTVFVQPNFVLEIALGQEQSAAADAILRLAEQGTIDRRIPAFSLGEPFSAVTHRGRARIRSADKRDQHSTPGTRSFAPHQQAASYPRPLPKILPQSERQEMDGPISTGERLLRAAQTIVLDVQLPQRAIRARERIGLSAQDAIIYAAAISELPWLSRAGPHVFISKNRKDFDNPVIPAEWATYDCQFFDSFVDGLRLLRRRVNADHRDLA